MSKKIQNEKQKEILKTIPKDKSGIIYVAQRVGKTKIAIDIIKRDKPKKILWVVPSKILVKKGLEEDFKKFKAHKLFKNVETSTWASLHKVKGDYNLIILDEVHHITYRNSQTLREEELRGRILGMSGTKTKSKDKQTILYDILKLPIFTSYNIKKAVEDRILSDYKVKLYPIELSEAKNIRVETKKHKFYTSQVKKYAYLTEQVEFSKITKNKSKMKMFALLRRHFLSSIPQKINLVKSYCKQNPNKRTLIFVTTQKQAEMFDYYYHSKSSDKHLKDFEEGKIPYLTLVNKGGTGYTFHNIDTILITQADSNVNGNVIQKIMRGMIADTKILNIYIFYVKNTQDEVWANAVIETFKK